MFEKPVPIGVLRKLLPAELRVRPGSADAIKAWQIALEAADSKRRTPGLDVNKLFDRMAKPHDAALRIEVAQAIAPYESRLTKLKQALAYPAWAKPLKPDSFVPTDTSGDIEFPQLSGFRELTKVLCLRAQLELDQGQPVKAMDDLLAARSMGEHMLAMDAPLISYLVAESVTAIADAQLRRLGPHFSVAELRRAQKHLGSAGGRETYLGAIRGEVEFYTIPLFARVERESAFPGVIDDEENKSVSSAWNAMLAGHPHPLDRAATIRMLVPILVAQIGNMRRPWSEQKPLGPQIDAITGELPKAFQEPDEEKPVPLSEVVAAKVRLLAIDNPLGKLLGPLSISNLTSTPAFQVETIREGARLVLAVQLFEKRTGRLPKALSDLGARDGVVRLPIDPFSGKPFLYNPQRREIWSVGISGLDFPKNHLKF